MPPAHHEAVVDAALAHGMHILSEKPIADSMAASVRIAAKVRRAGVKMGVTMSHRFDQDKTTLRDALRSGRYGALDYLVCRFTCDCRKFGSWGKFRYQIPDPLMVEGAVHHLDILADLAGAECDTIYAQTWNPPWGEFSGDSQALVTMQFNNGTRAIYEGAKTNAVGLNDWGQEYFRAECELATLTLDHRRLERLVYDSSLAAGQEPTEAERGDPLASTAQVVKHVADRKVRALARRRRADGNKRRGQPAICGPSSSPRSRAVAQDSPSGCRNFCNRSSQWKKLVSEAHTSTWRRSPMLSPLVTMDPGKLDPAEIFSRLPPNRCGEADRRYMNEVLDDGFGNRESAHMLERFEAAFAEKFGVEFAISPQLRFGHIVVLSAGRRRRPRR